MQSYACSNTNHTAWCMFSNSSCNWLILTQMIKFQSNFKTNYVINRKSQWTNLRILKRNQFINVTHTTVHIEKEKQCTDKSTEQACKNMFIHISFYIFHAHKKHKCNCFYHNNNYKIKHITQIHLSIVIYSICTMTKYLIQPHKKYIDTLLIVRTDTYSYNTA